VPVAEQRSLAASRPVTAPASPSWRTVGTRAVIAVFAAVTGKAIGPMERLRAVALAQWQCEAASYTSGRIALLDPQERPPAWRRLPRADRRARPMGPSNRPAPDKDRRAPRGDLRDARLGRLTVGRLLRRCVAAHMASAHSAGRRSACPSARARAAASEGRGLDLAHDSRPPRRSVPPGGGAVV
jgi:hypothetical protein